MPRGGPSGGQRVGEDVEVREDPAADPVEPGLLLVTADGHHESAVEHRTPPIFCGARRIVLPAASVSPASGTATSSAAPRTVLGVLVEEGGRRARGVGGRLGGLLRGVPASGQLAEVAGDVVLVTDPAGTRRLAQRSMVRCRSASRPTRRCRGVEAYVAEAINVVGAGHTADRAVVVAGRHAQDEGDGGGDDEESTGAAHDG